eukprot:3604847-Ditylum_brightwellii.AAC.2
MGEKEREGIGTRKKKKSKVKVIKGEWFPFLDMKMKWQHRKMLFQSTHRPRTFRSIANEVTQKHYTMQD